MGDRAKRPADVLSSKVEAFYWLEQDCNQDMTDLLLLNSVVIVNVLCSQLLSILRIRACSIKITADQMYKCFASLNILACFLVNLF